MSYVSGLGITLTPIRIKVPQPSARGQAGLSRTPPVFVIAADAGYSEKAVSARWLTWANRGLQGAVGIVTIAIGVTTIVENLLS